jgi:multicomponent Na+:H+ antiporter subunit E
LAIGIVLSFGVIFICHRLLPLPKILKDINLFKIVFYPFYLVVQVYLSAFNAIKLIFTGADASIIEVKTQLSNSFLKTILANSITLTPGSISLEIKDDAIILLWLKRKKESQQDAQKAGESITRRLEKILLKAQR